MGKVKTVNFSETIAASDLKVGRCRQLIGFYDSIYPDMPETKWFIDLM